MIPTDVLTLIASFVPLHLRSRMVVNRATRESVLMRPPNKPDLVVCWLHGKVTQIVIDGQRRLFKRSSWTMDRVDEYWIDTRAPPPPPPLPCCCWFWGFRRRLRRQMTRVWFSLFEVIICDPDVNELDLLPVYRRIHRSMTWCDVRYHRSYIADDSITCNFLHLYAPPAKPSETIRRPLPEGPTRVQHHLTRI
jgi:hypothetical protein